MPSRVLKFGEVHRSGSSPVLESIRNVVLPLLILEPNGTVRGIGTCFIISSLGETALALTAGHVVDYIFAIEGIRIPNANPVLPRLRAAPNPKVGLKNVECVAAYTDVSGALHVCQVDGIWRPGGKLDIAAIRISTKDSAVFTHRLPLRSYGPDIGERVEVIGYFELETVDHVRDEAGVISEQTLSLPLKAISAVVAERYTRNQHHLVKWPCFRFDRAVDHGMSGGPVLSALSEGEVVVSGIVSSGTSFSSESIASLLYPALNMSVDADFPFLENRHPTLLDLVAAGMIVDMSPSQHYLRSDHTWGDSPFFEFTLSNSEFNVSRDAKLKAESGGGSLNGAFRWLTEECVNLGQIFQPNGDQANYILISRDFFLALKQEREKSTAPVQCTLLARKQPYVWFKAGESVFRFFVFAVPGEKPMKILTDAVRMTETDQIP